MNSDKRGRNALFGTTVNPKKITYLVENKKQQFYMIGYIS